MKRSAQVNGKSEKEIRRILADKSARLDKSGRIYFVEQRAPRGVAPGPTAQAAFPYTETFRLHSRPGSNRVIYLDFDGETISGTQWNNQPSLQTPASFYAEPFSLDLAPESFSAAEQEVIQSVWQRVAEDFAPFDVDVTTQDPGLAAIDRSGTGDSVYGTRALITDATEIATVCGCGGVAFLGVFDAPTNHQRYQPALVFPHNLLDNAKYIAEAVTHEVGHNFGLSHDGAANGNVAYFVGTNAWAPIMGAGYAKPIVQWSKGEYAGANNLEDDMAVIAARGAPAIADEAGSTPSTALALPGSPNTVGFRGMIGARGDVDMFRFLLYPGTKTFTLTPSLVSPNLDIKVTLIDSFGRQLATSDPPSAMLTPDVATGMNATLTYIVPDVNHYFLSVSGTGSLDPLTTGYSAYGSIGPYELVART